MDTGWIDFSTNAAARCQAAGSRRLWQCVGDQGKAAVECYGVKRSRRTDRDNAGSDNSEVSLGLWRKKVNILRPYAKSDRLAGCNRYISSGSFNGAFAYVDPNAFLFDRGDPALKQILYTEKSRDGDGCGMIEDLRSTTTLLDSAGFNDRNTICEGARLRAIVCDEYGWKTTMAEKATKLVAKCGCGRGVQCAERFVEQEEIRPARERARQGHALLFPWTQIGGSRRGKVRDTEALEQGGDIEAIATRTAPEPDILYDREMGE